MEINWKRVCLRETQTIVDAIKVLDKEALRVVLVVDDGGKLLGTITDGDIRRAFIRHVGVDASLDEVMNRSPVVVFDHDRQSILSLMKNKGILQVPILNQDGVLIGLETIHHLLEYQKFDNPVFLMAGGFGRRLRPLTNDLPKPLIRIGNKPILEIILEQFIAAGFQSFFVSTHYKADMIEGYFGNGSKWGVRITYLHENEPLGTAGALSLLPNDLPSLPMIVMNGDLFTKVSFNRLLDFHDEQGGVATMCVREYDFQVPYGVVSIKGGHLSNIIEKPTQKFFVNAGIYVLAPTVFENVKEKKYLDMTTLLGTYINDNYQVDTFPLHEYWLDIGQIDQLEQARIDSEDFFND